MRTYSSQRQHEGGRAGVHISRGVLHVAQNVGHIARQVGKRFVFARVSPQVGPAVEVALGCLVASICGWHAISVVVDGEIHVLGRAISYAAIRPFRA